MVNDILLNSVQLNTGNISANIPSIKISKTFNNATYTRYKQVKPTIFPVSASNDAYSFEITLYGQGDIYQELLDKEKEIYDEINAQISNHDIITLTSSATPLYFNNSSVELLFNSADYTHRATDGKSFINLSFDCVFYGLAIGMLAGGNSSGIASLAIGSFNIGGA